jgi:formate dehydrogenase subunit gamma
MAGILAHARFVIGALALMFVVAAAAPAAAQSQTPLQLNPTASAVNEDKLLQQLRIIDGRVSIPDKKSGNLEQPAGRDWREFHQKTLPWIAALAILGMLAVLVIFYLSRGMVKIERGRSGRTVVRFNALERFVHWMTAGCFIILALSGLNITFGKLLLAPIFGLDAFAAWSQWAKYAHNYLSFPFTIGVALILLMWIAGNIPNKVDVEWVKRGGGIIGNDHPPAQRFNAGQKMIYWIVVLGGTASAITGYLLMFPFYTTGIEGMQTARRSTALSPCCSSLPCSPISTSAPSAWKVPSRRWARAQWTRTGPSSTTRCGLRRKSARARLLALRHAAPRPNSLRPYFKNAAPGGSAGRFLCEKVALSLRQDLRDIRVG